MDFKTIYSEMDKNVELYVKKQISKPIEKVDKINTSSISSVKKNYEKSI